LTNWVLVNSEISCSRNDSGMGGSGFLVDPRLEAHDRPLVELAVMRLSGSSMTKVYHKSKPQ